MLYKKSKRGLGSEDILHKNTAEVLTNYKIWFTYIPSGEKRSIMTGALLKAKGLKRGLPDFWIRYRVGFIMHHLYLEAKVGKNKQDREGFQKTFEESCKASVNEKYYIYKSLDELISILKKEGVI